MALEIGQVVNAVPLYPTRRGQTEDGTAANESALPLPGQQAPPLTGVGAKALSGDALQTLQGTGEAKDADGKEKPKGTGAPGDELDDEKKQVVEKLKQRDQEVRRHEAAHAATGGQYAGSPSFSYEQGPDGKRYAIGGEVSIDVSPGRTPEETARKADVIRAAALAPADPSGQDQAVAAAATKMKLDALAEGARQRHDEQEAKRAEDGEPVLPGHQKPDQPEVVGPKPPGSETTDAETTGAEKTGATGTDAASTGQRGATAAGAYSRTENAVNTIGKAANALSLVA